jgi:CBS domain-containing protein
MARSVSDAMTPDVSTVAPMATVLEAAKMMRDQDIGALPVVEDGHLIGMVTDRDIVVGAIADARDPQTAQVREICSSELVSVEPDQSVDEALELMAKHQVRRLPVVDHDDRLLGIVSQGDLSGEASSKKVGQAVEEISKPASQ